MAEKDNAQDEVVNLARGVSLMVFGAGLILSNPAVRNFLMGQITSRLSESEDVLQGLGGVLPDLERYMKIRSM